MAAGYRARLAAVGHLKLFEDVRHVDAHRLLSDEQARGDPPVGEALGQELEDLAFARGEAGRCGGRGWLARVRGFVAGRGFEVDPGPCAQLADLPRNGLRAASRGTAAGA